MLHTRHFVVVIVALGSLSCTLATEPKVKVEFRRAESKPAEGLTEAIVSGSTDKVYLHPSADLTNADIASARVITDQPAGLAIEITFTKDGVTKAAKMSEGHQDKPVAILVDGQVISAPIVKAKFGQKVLITGRFTKAEAEKLANSVQGK